MNLQVGKFWRRFHALIVGMLMWGIGAAVFFRISLLSGFAVVSGDVGDGRMIVYLHEHLFRWLLGLAYFASPPFYYPQPNVLGYADAFLLDLLAYSALRLLGFDPFLSMELFLIALSAVCFWSVYCLLSKYFRIRTYIALTAATLIAFPNDLFCKANAGHLQAFSLYYIPPILLLAARGLSGFPRITAGSMVLVVFASLFYALLFSTGFYVAWMFALTVLIATLYAGLQFRRQVVPFVKAHATAILALSGTAALCFAIGLIPFYVIYGPVRQLRPSRSFGEYVSFAPFPYDVINVSSWNALWGRVIDALLAPGKGQRVEQALAVTPGMTLIFLLSARAATRKPSADAAQRRWEIHFAMATIAVLAISWLLTVRIGSVSLYWLPYHLLPGASAIRVGGRIQLLVNLWIVTGLALLIDRRLSAAPLHSWKLLYAAAAAVFLFCMVEQINLIQLGIPRAFELKALAAVPTPPNQCQSFLIASSRGRASIVDHVDAMWISLKAGLPTLNGNSGWSPPNWRLDDPSIDYLAAARAWIKTSNLTGEVCLYDQESRRWSPF